ncbi:precursor of CEP9-like [Cannabis sativa]|uniref:precursor of CEP9-like n=1 Tax=Cannabis sativa TaxID=3483 RepID=UPI0029CA5A57|nr:precursor of CEP9-like [Cannabis sativa]
MESVILCKIVALIIFGFHIGIVSVQAGRPIIMEGGTKTTEKVGQVMIPTNSNDKNDNGNHFSSSVDAFRPANPGKSPGPGTNSKTTTINANDNNNKQSEQQRHVVSGNTDDFRPTAPGHSPGIGHSLLGRN